MQASLALMSPGQQGIITEVGGSRGLRVRLMELGLLPGTPVEVVRRAPLDGPMHLTARGCHLSIRRADAARILIRLADSATSQLKGRAA